MELFPSHGKNSPQSRKFSINKKFFSKKKFCLDQGSFPETNTSTQSKQFSSKKDKKVATLLTLKIQKGFSLQKLSTRFAPPKI